MPFDTLSIGWGQKIFNKEPRGTFALKIQYIRLFATRKTSTTIDRNASGYTCFFQTN
jgi:hypothetical protein